MWGRVVRRRVKFWLLFFLGFCIFIPPFLFTIMVQVFESAFSVYGVLFAASFLGWFSIYCYFIYRSIYKRSKLKYPLVPPEGRMTDRYFPRTRIPRPIYEDARRYPEFFKRKEMKREEELMLSCARKEHRSGFALPFPKRRQQFSRS